jgi:hypothetical protein
VASLPSVEKGADVLGLATVSWLALVLGLFVAFMIAYAVTRE